MEIEIDLVVEKNLVKTMGWNYDMLHGAFAD